MKERPRACCKCGRWLKEGGDCRRPEDWIWRPEVSSRSLEVTHGYCPMCFREALDEVRRAYGKEEKKTEDDSPAL